MLLLLAKALLIFLLLGSAFGTVFGVGIAVRANWCVRMNELMSRWISTRLMLKPVEVPRDTQRALYRHHRLLGALVLAGAAYALAVLATLPDLRGLAVQLAKRSNPHVMEVYLRAGWAFLLVGNAAALLAGLALLLRPSLLKGVEAWANRSISLRSVGRFLETMNYAPDRLVQTYPRVAGTLIAAGSLWVAAHLTVTLFAQR